MYVNGVEQTLQTNNFNSNSGMFRASQSLQIGQSNDAGYAYHHSGYVAEVIGLYDQTKDADDFGELKNGVWVPKQYSSFPNSQDFYLKFSNSSNLGEDFSGNDNDFTNNNMTADNQTLDSPTFGSDSNGGNFCTLNTNNNMLSGDSSSTKLTIKQGNLATEDGGSYYSNVIGTHAVSGTGKYYYEYRVVNPVNNGNRFGFIDVSKEANVATAASSPGYPGSTANSWTANNNAPNSKIQFSNNNSTFAREYTGAAQAAGDIWCVGLDLSTGKWYVSKNAALDPANAATASASSGTIELHDNLDGGMYAPSAGEQGGSDSHYNFGQDSTFGGAITAGTGSDANGYGNFKYAPPADYLAFCSANLSHNDNIDPAETDTNYPQKLFGVLTYTGTGSSNAITGLGFQPDLVWISQRSSTEDPSFYDSSRGTTKRLKSSSTEAESTVAAGFTAFGSDGFTVGSATENNASTQTYVAWCWKANGGSTSSNTDGTITTTLQVNSAAGFSIGTYTGTGSNATVGHGLGARPDMSIFRERGTAGNWIVTWQPVMASNDHNLYLQITNAESDGNYFQNTAATTSVISIGTHADINGSSNTYVMYNWINVEGFSKFGSYEGNGAADGTFVYCGFRPAFVMTKSLDSTSDWSIFDIKREGYNVDNDELHANDGDAEGTADMIDIYSNGFKSRIATDPNVAETYVFMAMADNPFKYATAR